jgi:hypothetical protein
LGKFSDNLLAAREKPFDGRPYRRNDNDGRRQKDDDPKHHLDEDGDDMAESFEYAGQEERPPFARIKRVSVQ